MNKLHYTSILAFLSSGIFFASINHWAFMIPLIWLPLFLIAQKSQKPQEPLIGLIIFYGIFLAIAISIFGFIFPIILLYMYTFFTIFKN